MGKPEAEIEQALIAMIERNGGRCFKFVSGTAGVPDRICLVAGRTLFVECKRRGATPRPLQRAIIRDINQSGNMAFYVNSQEDIDELEEVIVKEWKPLQPRRHRLPVQQPAPHGIRECLSLAETIRQSTSPSDQVSA